MKIKMENKKKYISELTYMKIKCNSKINKIYVISNRWNILGWWYWVRLVIMNSSAGGNGQYRFYSNRDPSFITSRVVLLYYLLNFICYKLKQQSFSFLFSVLWFQIESPAGFRQLRFSICIISSRSPATLLYSFICYSVQWFMDRNPI